MFSVAWNSELPTNEKRDAPSPAPTLGEWHGRIFNVTLTPTDDGYVNTWACCSDDNFGANNKLRLKQTSRVVYMAYLRFRLGADDAPLELLERHNYTFSLRAATLRLRTFEAPLVDTTVYLVGNSSFHESNLTYDNAPPPRSISTSIAPPADLQLAYRENLGANFTDGIGWEAFDLDVERMGGVGAPVARGDRFAFQLRSTDSDVVSYSSKEGDGPPELVLSLEASRATARPTLSPAPTRAPTPTPSFAPTPSLAPTTAASRFSLDADTVFEVTGEDGARAYYRNLASTVRIADGMDSLSERTPGEEKFLKKKPADDRLACQALVNGDATVEALPGE